MFHVFVHAVPERVAPAALVGKQAVVIDQLRASTTITHALAAGAVCVVPCLEPAEAIGLRAAPPADLREVPIVLGGERGGLLIPGFDLGNSPAEYTQWSVGGKAVVFTTTNGTRALMIGRSASRLLVGCLANRGALADVLADDGRDVHLICAGVQGAVAEEDCLAAGAIAAALAVRGAELDSGDGGPGSAMGAARAFAAAAESEGGVARELRRSTGGRNLCAIGLDADIDLCARLDVLQCVGVADVVTMRIQPVQPAA